jgi:hypothetical protein
METKATELQEHIEGDTVEEDVEYTESNDTTSMTVMDEDDRKVRYSRSVVKVTKKRLAKYIVTARCFCFIMMWIHLSMSVISVLVTQYASEVSSEAYLCRNIFYTSHIAYAAVQLLVAVLYFYLFNSVTVRALQDIRKMDWILIIFALLSIYVIALKILADLNCTFWSISTSQIISQALQFGAEGFFLRLFYGWLESKTSVLKENLEANVDIMETANYFERKFGKGTASLSKYLN